MNFKKILILELKTVTNLENYEFQINLELNRISLL